MWPSKALRFLKSHLWLSCFFVITCFTLWAYYLWDWIATFSFLMMICVILLLYSNRIRTYMRMPCRENYSQSVVTGCCSGAHYRKWTIYRLKHKRKFVSYFTKSNSSMVERLKNIHRILNSLAKRSIGILQRFLFWYNEDLKILIW